MGSMNPLLPLMLGTLLIPAPVSAALESAYIFFPDSELVMTPADAGLAYEEVSFAAADGTALHGWFVPGRPELPALLFCHGNAGNISHRVDNLRLLHRLGLNVLIFDYRGYGRSSGRPTEEGTYNDARGALAWLERRGWGPDRTILFGRSLGAAVALQLALEVSPAGVILESPFTSVAAMGRHHSPILWLLAGWLLNARYDNLEKIVHLKAPLMILHGDADDIVPARMGRALYEKAPEPKRFHLLPGAGHNDSYEVGGDAYWSYWRDFVEDVGRGRVK